MSSQMALTFLLIFSALSSFADEHRVWTNRKGQKVEAELIDYTESHVKIRSSRDGKIYTYEISNLSTADQAYLKSLSTNESKLNHTGANRIGETIRSLVSEKLTLKSILIGVPSIVILIAALRGRLLNNLFTGICFGCIAGVIGAMVWASISLATGYQIGWMAVGVGIIVGFAVRAGGNPDSPLQGIVGGGLALFSCVLGNIFCGINLNSNEANTGLLHTLLHLDMSQSLEAYQSMFTPIDILFYLIAIYEGAKFSTRSKD
jgi:hypothetical protein